MAEKGLRLEDPAPFAPQQSLGEALLTPTRIYVRSLLRLHQAGLLKAAAHITGGGLIGNLPRVLPEGVVAKLDASRWQLPEVFVWLAQAGGIPPAEMFRVFNCGIGMALVVSDAAQAQSMLTGLGETVFPIGTLASGEGPARVEITFPTGWFG